MTKVLKRTIYLMAITVALLADVEDSLALAHRLQAFVFMKQKSESPQCLDSEAANRLE